MTIVPGLEPYTGPGLNAPVVLNGVLYAYGSASNNTLIRQSTSTDEGLTWTLNSKVNNGVSAIYVGPTTVVAVSDNSVQSLDHATFTATPFTAMGSILPIVRFLPGTQNVIVAGQTNARVMGSDVATVIARVSTDGGQNWGAQLSITGQGSFTGVGVGTTATGFFVFYYDSANGVYFTRSVATNGTLGTAVVTSMSGPTLGGSYGYGTTNAGVHYLPRLPNIGNVRVAINGVESETTMRSDSSIVSDTRSFAVMEAGLPTVYFFNADAFRPGKVTWNGSVWSSPTYMSPFTSILSVSSVNIGGVQKTVALIDPNPAYPAVDTTKNLEYVVLYEPLEPEVTVVPFAAFGIPL